MDMFVAEGVNVDEIAYQVTLFLILSAHSHKRHTKHTKQFV
jgi:hypothetical protein